MIDLAHRSGEVSVIMAQIVYENDEFEYSFGLEPKLDHKPAKGDRGKPVFVYAMYRTKDGGYGYEVMSMEDVRKHAQKFSKAYNSGPWQTNFEEMAKKGLAVDTMIPTPNGWTTMGELETGDTVFDMNGNPTKVIATSEVKHIECFKVTFSNGESIVCDNEHRWVAQTTKNAARNVREHGWEVFTVNELYDLVSDEVPVTIPVNPSLNLPDRDDLLIDPWALGYWLGNGAARHAKVTCDINDSAYVKKMLSRHYEVSDLKAKDGSNAAEIGIKSNFVALLRKEGVLMNKHIPDKYKRAGYSQRLALLQGLIDSDGHVDAARGRAIFSNCNKRLIDDVIELAVSLGECVSTSKSHAKGFGKEVDLYNVTWLPVNPPAGMPRKAERVRERKTVQYRSIRSIEKIESVPTKCIAVDSDTKTYLAGRAMIPTHNTVLKKVLKYAPLKSDFARAVAQDETIKTELSPDMYEVADVTVYEDGTVEVADDGNAPAAETTTATTA